MKSPSGSLSFFVPTVVRHGVSEIESEGMVGGRGGGSKSV